MISTCIYEYRLNLMLYNFQKLAFLSLTVRSLWLMTAEGMCRACGTIWLILSTCAVEQKVQECKNARTKQKSVLFRYIKSFTPHFFKCTGFNYKKSHLGGQKLIIYSMLKKSFFKKSCWQTSITQLSLLIC